MRYLPVIFTILFFTSFSGNLLAAKKKFYLIPKGTSIYSQETMKWNKILKDFVASKLTPSQNETYSFEHEGKSYNVKMSNVEDVSNLYDLKPKPEFYTQVEYKDVAPKYYDRQSSFEPNYILGLSISDQGFLEGSNFEANSESNKIGLSGSAGVYTVWDFPISIGAIANATWAIQGASDLSIGPALKVHLGSFTNSKVNFRASAHKSLYHKFTNDELSNGISLSSTSFQFSLEFEHLTRYGSAFYNLGYRVYRISSKSSDLEIFNENNSYSSILLAVGVTIK